MLCTGRFKFVFSKSTPEFTVQINQKLLVTFVKLFNLNNFYQLKFFECQVYIEIMFFVIHIPNLQRVYRIFIILIKNIWEFWWKLGKSLNIYDILWGISFFLLLKNMFNKCDIQDNFIFKAYGLKLKNNLIPWRCKVYHYVNCLKNGHEHRKSLSQVTSKHYSNGQCCDTYKIKLIAN